MKKGYESNSIKVQIGGVDSGTAIDDENKLVIKYESKDGINDNGSYIIDGVREVLLILFFIGRKESRVRLTR